MNKESLDERCGLPCGNNMKSFSHKASVVFNFIELFINSNDQTGRHLSTNYCKSHIFSDILQKYI